MRHNHDLQLVVYVNKKHNAEVKLMETRMPYLLIEDMVAAQKAR